MKYSGSDEEQVLRHVLLRHCLDAADPKETIVVLAEMHRALEGKPGEREARTTLTNEEVEAM